MATRDANGKFVSKPLANGSSANGNEGLELPPADTRTRLEVKGEEIIRLIRQAQVTIPARMEVAVRKACLMGPFPTPQAEAQALADFDAFAKVGLDCAWEGDEPRYKREEESFLDTQRRRHIPPRLPTFSEDLADHWHQRMNLAGWLGEEIESIRDVAKADDADRLAGFDATSCSLRSGKRVTRLQIREEFLCPIALRGRRDLWHAESKYQQLEQAEQLSKERERLENPPVTVSAGMPWDIGKVAR
jgi:hypothetical protein